MAARTEASRHVVVRKKDHAAGDQPPSGSHRPVPPAAKWLGVMGLIPFVTLAVASLPWAGPTGEWASFALAAYGAVILSFLGGIHWGLAVAGFGPATRDEIAWSRLVVGVSPSLLGWGALFLPRPFDLLLLASAFALLLAVDSRLSRTGHAPAWYPMLRLPLTIVVVATLGLAALA